MKLKWIHRKINQVSELLDYVKKSPQEIIEPIIAVLILLSVIVAFLSILIVDDYWIEKFQNILTYIFIVELTVRFYLFNSRRNHSSKWYSFFSSKEYLYDVIGTIPFDTILMFFIEISNPGMHLLRLFRLPRLLRLFRLKKLNNERYLKYSYFIKKEFEKSIVHQFSIILVITFFFVTVSGLIFDLKHSTFFENGYWFSLISLMTDNGMAEPKMGSAPIYMKLLVSFLTFSGMILFNGLFIAIIVTKIQKGILENRKGKARVFESNHYVILGWSNIIPDLVRELNIYCLTEKKHIKLVILNELMDEEVLNKLKSYINIEVIYRSGNPYDFETLKNISIDKSKSIIVLGNGRSANSNNDLLIIRSFTLIKKIIDDIKKKKSVNPETPSILLSLQNKYVQKHIYDLNDNIKDKPKNKLKIIFFNKNEYTSDLFYNFIYDPDSSRTYTELFSFDGDEFHFFPVNEIFVRNVGKFKDLKKSDDKGDEFSIEFSDLFKVLDNVIPIGFIKNTDTNNKVFELNPSPTDLIKQGDKIIFLAENEMSLEFSKTKYFADMKLDNKSIEDKSNLENCNEQNDNKYNDEDKKILIIGVNKKVNTLIKDFKYNKREIYLSSKESDLDTCFKNYEFLPDKNKELINKYILFNVKDLEPLIALIKNENIKKILFLSDSGNLSEKEFRNISERDTDTFYKVLELHSKLKEEKTKSCKIFCEALTPETENVFNALTPAGNTNGQNQISSINSNKLISRIMNMMFLSPDTENIIKSIISKSGKYIRTDCNNKGRCINIPKEPCLNGAYCDDGNMIASIDVSISDNLKSLYQIKKRNYTFESFRELIDNKRKNYIAKKYKISIMNKLIFKIIQQACLLHMDTIIILGFTKKNEDKSIDFVFNPTLKEFEIFNWEKSGIIYLKKK